MWKLFIADLKIILRNKQALFWSLMFPLMFTFIFGLFFGKSTNIGTIAIINKSESKLATNLVDAVKKVEGLKVGESENLEEVKELILKGKYSAILKIPESFGSPDLNSEKTVTIIYDPGSAQISQVMSGIVGNYLTAVNFQIANAQPIYSEKMEPLNENKLTYFDFILTGVLGLALMNSSIIGIAVSMAKYREDKILKRITTTPVKSWVFILAEVLSRMILNLFQIGIILLIGVYLFDAHIYGSVWVVLVICMLAAMLFQMIGFAISSFAKTADAAQGMATAITIPMMFLAGVFFPIDALPKWLYSIVQYLPLAPVLRVIRGVTLENLSPFSDPKNMIIVISWIILALIVSIYKFRLADE